MEDIKISIIMGVFNPRNEAVLFQAVESIVKQTFQAWEMIIYDDGSDEIGARLIKNVMRVDSRIIYIRNEQNYGLAFALNQCLAIAKGKYIARMDDDDISDIARLDKLYEFMETHSEYQWIGSNAELFDENGVWGIEKKREIPQKKDFLSYSPYIHSSVMFSKEVLLQNKGYKVSKVTKRCEDYELFMRLSAKGYQGYNLQECLLQYREDSVAYKKRKYKYYIREMQIRYDGFRKLGILNIKTFGYVCKPVIVGLVPVQLLAGIKKRMKRI